MMFMKREEYESISFILTLFSLVATPRNVKQKSNINLYSNVFIKY